MRRGIVARGLGLERNLLVDDDCGVGWYDWSVDIALGAVGLHLLHQREDDEKDNQVEDKVADRDPVLEINISRLVFARNKISNLQTCPVSGYDYVEIFSAGHHCDDDPEYEEAVVP